jgi:lipid-A-disaccharide synthase-like uncharacterized protein
MSDKQVVGLIGIMLLLWFSVQWFYTNYQNRNVYNPPIYAIPSVQPKPPYHY